VKVYIAGPMTGYLNFNYDAFHKAAAAWRKAGWEVENPAEHFGGRTDLDYPAYIRAAIESVLGCDAIAPLNGWMSSRGATLEMGIALAIDLLVLDVYHPQEPPK